MQFLETLYTRNETQFYFGLICLLASIFFLLLTRISTIQVSGVNAWFKPFKFAFSTVLYAWAMGWFTWYLKDFYHPLFNWSVVILLGFEIIYIAIQAARGQKSHFNLSSPFYAFLYSLMAFAASAVAIYTAYVGVLFFTQSFPELTESYVWGIRLGIWLFVIFSFEGFVMGARLSHTIGGPDGGEGLPLVNWSKKFGDPRVAHFIGMHALQVLPFLGFYVFTNSIAIISFGLLYLSLAIFTLVQALKGKPLLKG